MWRGRSSNGTASVAIIGDSITVNSADDLSRALEPEYDVDIRAQSGRRIDEMLPALRTALSAHPREVVVNLGTNDVLQAKLHADWRAGFNQLIGLLAPVRCVALTTVSTRLDGPTARPGVAPEINEALVRAIAAHRNFHIIDWNARIHEPDGASLIIFDGIHPTPAGELVLAGLTRTTLDRDCRGRPGAPTTTPPAIPTTMVTAAAAARRYPPGPTGGPPTFGWSYGDPLFCDPKLAAVFEAGDADRRAGALSLADSSRGARVLLVGDSTACSLYPGLAAAGASAHIRTDQGVVFGCGVASDRITTTRNEAITPHSERCHGMVDWAVGRALARAQPTVVIWMSVWEKSDLVVDGRTVVAGTPAWETEITARMDWALARLTAGGARVVLVTVPAPAPNAAQRTEKTDPAADDAGYVRLDALLRRFHDRHPDTTTLVDLAAKVCPGGPPCPERVEGMRARPDGRHFTPAAAAWAARWLVTRRVPEPHVASARRSLSVTASGRREGACSSLHERSR